MTRELCSLKPLDPEAVHSGSKQLEARDILALKEAESGNTIVPVVLVDQTEMNTDYMILKKAYIG